MANLRRWSLSVASSWPAVPARSSPAVSAGGDRWDRRRNRGEPIGSGIGSGTVCEDNPRTGSDRRPRRSGRDRAGRREKQAAAAVASKWKTPISRTATTAATRPAGQRPTSHRAGNTKVPCHCRATASSVSGHQDRRRSQLSTQMKPTRPACCGSSAACISPPRRFGVMPGRPVVPGSSVPAASHGRPRVGTSPTTDDAR